jgi:hypothetical protein
VTIRHSCRCSRAFPAQDLSPKPPAKPCFAAQNELSPLFPLLTRHIAVSPLFPTDTKNMGWGAGIGRSGAAFPFGMLPRSTGLQESVRTKSNVDTTPNLVDKKVLRRTAGPALRNAFHTLVVAPAQIAYGGAVRGGWTRNYSEVEAGLGSCGHEAQQCCAPTTARPLRAVVPSEVEGSWLPVNPASIDGTIAQLWSLASICGGGPPQKACPTTARGDRNLPSSGQAGRDGMAEGLVK